jgi:hypothetical protein
MGLEDDIAQGLNDVERGSGDEDEEEERPAKKGKKGKENEKAKPKPKPKTKREKKVIEIPRDGTPPISSPFAPTLTPLLPQPLRPQAFAAASDTATARSTGGAKNASSTAGEKAGCRSFRILRRLFGWVDGSPFLFFCLSIGFSALLCFNLLLFLTACS